MIDLNDKYIVQIDRASSKGNQMKWYDGSFWFKVDNNGYEGLSEYVVSKLLKKSSLKVGEYVDYELEQIRYKNHIYNACKSKNFLKPGSRLITLQRLFDSMGYDSLFDVLDQLITTKDKVQYLVNNVIALTGLNDFGQHLYKLFVVDALFLNDDRHAHNIALIMNDNNTFDYCPIFDNGACLLSDTRVDYPYSGVVVDMIKNTKPKMFDSGFIDVINDLESLYSTSITFDYNDNDIDSLVNGISIYDEITKERVKQILKYQRNRMLYFF